MHINTSFACLQNKNYGNYKQLHMLMKLEMPNLTDIGFAAWKYQLMYGLLSTLVNL